MIMLMKCSKENYMKDVTLVVMAAGLGSRFGGGIKQLEPMGPHGEIIMDYSIHDAIEAGFNKVVFVTRKELLKDFDEIIGQRVKQKVNVEYAFQEVDDIPCEYKEVFKDRVKPWGTGQAILACKGIVNEPFLVINADDYYGKEAYKEAYKYLSNEHNNDNVLPISMVGFELKNTLSENGGVTRGICVVNEDHELLEVVETTDIIKEKDKAIANGKELDLNCLVSMNMWGLTPAFIDYLEVGFKEFISHVDKDDLKAEYLLPRIIDQLLKDNKAIVKVLRSTGTWFGVTYKEDKQFVKDSIKALIEQGLYPEKL